MRHLTVSPLLRLALRLDAIASLGAGALACLAATPLQAMIGAAPAQIFGVGLFMLAYGAVVGWLSLQRKLPSWAVWTIVLGNLLWAVESVLLTFSDWLSPSASGLVLLLGQAAVVALLAELQFIGLRRSPTLVPA